MCLARRFKRSYDGNVGYKVVFKEDGHYRTGITPIGEEVRLFKRKFTKDTREEPLLLNNQSGKTYPAGFHIFTKLEGARKLRLNGKVICKVKFRQQVAFGSVRWSFWDDQWYTPTVVARECRILSEVT